jgi:hypothetical protein
MLLFFLLGDVGVCTISARHTAIGEYLDY